MSCMFFASRALLANRLWPALFVSIRIRPIKNEKMSRLLTGREKQILVAAFRGVASAAILAAVRRIF